MGLARSSGPTSSLQLFGSGAHALKEAKFKEALQVSFVRNIFSGARMFCSSHFDPTFFVLYHCMLSCVLLSMFLMYRLRKVPLSALVTKLHGRAAMRNYRRVRSGRCSFCTETEISSACSPLQEGNRTPSPSQRTDLNSRCKSLKKVVVAVAMAQLGLVLQAQQRRCQ